MRETQQFSVVVKADGGRRAGLWLDQHYFTEDLLGADLFQLVEHPHVGAIVGGLFPLADFGVNLLAKLLTAFGLLPKDVLVTVNQCSLADVAEKTGCFDPDATLDHDEGLHVVDVGRVLGCLGASVGENISALGGFYCVPP